MKPGLYKVSNKGQPTRPSSLKTMLKESNKRFVSELERNYSLANKKHTALAVQLAQVYIDGKRVPQDFSRAIEILSNSSLIEAKFMLVEVAIQLQNFCEAYHYLEFFTFAKCV